jgi:hypothetical protein
VAFSLPLSTSQQRLRAKPFPPAIRNTYSSTIDTSAQTVLFTDTKARARRSTGHRSCNRDLTTLPNSTSFFSTLIIALSMLASACAIITSRDTTVDLFHAAVHDMVDGYQNRDNLAGTLVMTKAVTNTARYEACTVTVSWTHPGAAETFVVPAVITYHQTGVPLVVGGSGRSKRELCHKWGEGRSDERIYRWDGAIQQNRTIVWELHI